MRFSLLWFLLSVSKVDPAVPFTKGAAMYKSYLVAMLRKLLVSILPVMKLPMLVLLTNASVSGHQVS